MRSYFDIKNGKLFSEASEKAKIRVFTVEDETEKKELTTKMGIDLYDIDAALDPDEISRVEYVHHLVSIIWKQPYKASSLETDFRITSTGLFLHDYALTIIIKENLIPFTNNEFKTVNSIIDVILKYFFYTIRQYLNHLKAIKQASVDLQSKVNYSLENKSLIDMFNLSESLVYYLNAIEANGGVLEKLRENVEQHEKYKFTPEQIALLEDIILENRQCARQAQIYSTVLSGLMDARGNIINNNMNVLLRKLTLINVVFLPLSLIAGVGGMSEFSRFLDKYKINWEIGFVFLGVAIFTIGWVIWSNLKKLIASWGGGNGH